MPEPAVEDVGRDGVGLDVAPSALPQPPEVLGVEPRLGREEDQFFVAQLVPRGVRQDALQRRDDAVVLRGRPSVARHLEVDGRLRPGVEHHRGFGEHDSVGPERTDPEVGGTLVGATELAERVFQLVLPVGEGRGIAERPVVAQVDVLDLDARADDRQSPLLDPTPDDAIRGPSGAITNGRDRSLGHRTLLEGLPRPRVIDRGDVRLIGVPGSWRDGGRWSHPLRRTLRIPIPARRRVAGSRRRSGSPAGSRWPSRLLHTS